MEALEIIDTILDSMKTEPLSYIVPMVMPIALECKDYQGYSLLAHWNCPLCDEVSANAVQVLPYPRVWLSTLKQTEL